MKNLNTRQYVGARYVPKLAGEWDNKISYENLVIVTYKGNSFTSKQPVPQGIDINNTDYWINTGNFNAQLDEINKKISTLSNKNVIIIGDSYGTTNGSTEGNVTPYTERLKNLVNFNYYKYYCQNGAGFVNDRFYNLLSSAETNDTLTDLYVFGGWNDINETKADITTAISKFATLAKNKYPNAKLHLGLLGWGYHITSEQRTKFNTIHANSYGMCTKYGFDVYEPTFDVCVQETTDFWYSLTSGNGREHPSNNGSEFISIRLANLINYGAVNFSYNSKIELTALNGLTVGGNLYEYHTSGLITLTKGDYDINITNSNFDLPSFWGGTYLDIAEEVNSISGHTETKVIIPVSCRYKTTGNFIDTTILLKISNGKLSIISSGAKVIGITEMHILVPTTSVFSLL